MFLIYVLCGSVNVVAAASGPMALPEVAQGADVHSLSKTYCCTLWQNIMSGPDYIAATTPSFKDIYKTSIEELGALILKIKANQPVLVCGRLNTMEEPIAGPDLLSHCDYFDATTHPQLMVALKSMSVLGKHKGQSDFDGETNGKVNEIFAYVWSKVKENPSVCLPAFLIGLVDAASTCIQGYSVRMLCAVHPPRLKIVVKKK
jgi:hypothetical protein